MMGISSNKAPDENRDTEPDQENVRVYLLVCAVEGEYTTALKYATNLAKSNGGRLGILHVSRVEDFQNWANIEDRMRREMRDKAEKLVWSVANDIADMGGPVPSIYLEEGDLLSVLTDILDRDEQIKALILEANTGASNPGPMVSHYAGKGVSDLKVPLIVVPDHIDVDRFDSSKDRSK